MLTSPSNAASAGATEAYRARHRSAVFRMFEGLALSTLGVTTSRRAGVDSSRALTDAFTRGINVFDVVPYCRDGAAEYACADAIAQITADGGRREELVVMTRAGFLQEPVLDFGLFTTMVEERYVRPGVFAWDDLADGNHCLAPAFLRRSLAASLERLRLPSVDVFFIASPATQLTVVSPRGLEQRLRLAFEALERCVDEGTIRHYGIADVAGLDLARVVELAKEVAGSSHHLRAIQNPLCLHQAREHLQPDHSLRSGAKGHVFEVARDLGLHAFATRAVAESAAEYEMDGEARRMLGAGLVTDPQIALQWARSLPGVSTVLVGMRRSAHLEENCVVLEGPVASAEIAEAFLDGGES